MCKCIENINKGLAARNTVLDVPEVVNLMTGKFEAFDRVQIATLKLDQTKRKPKAVLLSPFCPFCGKRY